MKLIDENYIIYRRDLPREAIQILTTSNEGRVLGLHVLCDIVREMNTPLQARTLTQHRKVVSVIYGITRSYF